MREPSGNLINVSISVDPQCRPMDDCRSIAEAKPTLHKTVTTSKLIYIYIYIRIITFKFDSYNILDSSLTCALYLVLLYIYIYYIYIYIYIHRVSKKN